MFILNQVEVSLGRFFTIWLDGLNFRAKIPSGWLFFYCSYSFRAFSLLKRFISSWISSNFIPFLTFELKDREVIFLEFEIKNIDLIGQRLIIRIMKLVNEWVLQSCFHSYSLFWVEFQHFRHQIDSHRTSLFESLRQF